MIEAPTAPLPAPGSKPRRRHPVARAFGAIIGWVCAALAALGVGVHFLDTTHQVLIVLASGAWVFAPPSVVALGLALWRRAWLAVGLAAVLVVADVLIYAPLYVGDPVPTGPSTTVHVLTQNMLYGEADATQLVDEVRTSGVDVFAVQELTPQAAERLRAAGLEKLLPFSLLDLRPAAAGTGVWSRFPISDEQRLASQGLAGVVGSVELRDGTAVTIASLHPDAPYPQDPIDWYRDLDHIRSLLLALPAGPVLVGGDFNSTYDNARFRRLLVDGWRDGAEQAGSGVVRSWPADQAIPPVVGIDHVLTHGAVARAARTLRVSGSDHLGLLATVVVPR